jgi:uncharacterized membrane protein YphA (DoxX/SURF4 family)
LVLELVAHILPRFCASGAGLAILHITDMCALLVGASLLLGALTPLVAIAGGIFTLVALQLPASASHFCHGCEIAHVLALAVSIALVGPGAYSMDARFFGRREIIVPRLPASDRDDL